MGRQVKGELFVDYVRILRARKDVHWPNRLAAEDLSWLSTRIDLQGWYPMDAFERLGLAILNVVVAGELEMVRAFGQASVAWLSRNTPELVAQGDPRETLMRFHVLRQSYFDYAPLELIAVSDGEAALRIDYQMGDAAEEAAAQQTMGFFEALLEAGGARKVNAWFASRRWAGDPETVLELTWQLD